MKKIITLIIFIVAAVIIGRQVLAVKKTPPAALPPQRITPVIPTSPTKQKEAIIPKRLRIPSLHVNALVESVGMDSKGRMDVPSRDENVAWYRLGFVPGGQGSAVIDGHYDTASGKPAVFYNLSQLIRGDEVIVEDQKGQQLTFRVTEKKLFPFDKFPLQQVFNTTDQPRLNLITCDGIWNAALHNYSQRLVVFTTLTTNY